jgi:iduronate 2-sulfatase
MMLTILRTSPGYADHDASAGNAEGLTGQPLRVEPFVKMSTARMTLPALRVNVMKRLTPSSLCWLPIFLFCAPVLLAAEQHPNVLLLCVDDLRPELNSFGKGYISSPNIDELAASGRAFHRHYVQAPTCGASRYALLTGRYGPGNNDALFVRAKQLAKKPSSVSPSLPAWFRQHGYVTVSVGKVSHHPGGRGGPDWNDDQQLEMPNSWDQHLMPSGPWQHPRGAMHGLANGEIRIQRGQMDVFQSLPGPDSIYPDGLIAEESMRQLEQLADPEADQPFFLAVGLIRPHLPFGAPEKYLEPYRSATLPPTPHSTKPLGKTTWHRSGEFMGYNRWKRNPNDDAEFAEQVRKHYAACVSYADAQVGKILRRLDQLDPRRDTIVVLWGDHGWHLGEHAIWGKHALFEESLRSPLIIRYVGIPQPGAETRSLVETLDIFPTLCDLAGIPTPEFTQGVSLRPILESPNAVGHPAISYGRGRTLRTNTHRLIVHGDGFVELYDHTTAAKETRNVAAEHSELVKELLTTLNERLPAESSR